MRVRGDKLPPDLRREVLARYIYRWTSDNKRREEAWAGLSKPTMALQTDAEWLAEHVFYVTKEGKLDERHRFAEPAY